MKRFVVDQLGLKHTGTFAEEAVLHRAAVGHIYDAGDGGYRPVEHWVQERSGGPAGSTMFSTARDVATFLQDYMIGNDCSKLLSLARRTEMFEQQVGLPNCSVATKVCLGWLQYDGNGTVAFGHDGATVGQWAFARMNPNRAAVIVLFANGGKSHGLFSDVMGLMRAEGVDMPVPDAPSPSEDLVACPERFVGLYETTSSIAEVSEECGQLILAVAPRRETYPLTRQWISPLRWVDADLFVTEATKERGRRYVSFIKLPEAEEAKYLHMGGRAMRRADPEFLRGVFSGEQTN